jgi:D-threo-aldose 1-dehydrogenase
MLPTRKLLGTNVVTSAVGFGCAGLFALPQRNTRRSVLAAMYDSGIRHFDVAPMYGLGLAEAELGSFLRHRRADATITTKFGIGPTLLAKAAAEFQGPLRAFLTKRPNVREGLRDSGRGPHSGLAGHLLYSSHGYNRRSAQLTLERSLRLLRTDFIDVFLLHDPIGHLISGAPDLVDYLNNQCSLGRIRCWGITGQPSHLPAITKFFRQVPVAQFRDDIFQDYSLDNNCITNRAKITYGALAYAFPIIRRFLIIIPGAADKWNERVGVDLTAGSNLSRMLLSAAIRRNADGPVLFTTTRPERGQVAAEAALRSLELSDIDTALSDLAAEARRTYSQRISTP